MHGPFVKLIEKYRCLRLLRSSTKGCGSPSPRLEGSNGYLRPVGLAVHRENKMIIGFHFARIFWDLTLQEKFWDLSLKESSET